MSWEGPRKPPVAWDKTITTGDHAQHDVVELRSRQAFAAWSRTCAVSVCGAPSARTVDR